MILPNTRIILATITLISFSGISAMVFDNRYFPLIQYPYISVLGRESHITGDFFVTTASNATDDRERSIGIAELSGPFDQAQLALSMTLAGFPNPLDPPILINGELPWMLAGKLQTQGFAFSYRQYINCNFSVGIYTLVMRSNSFIDFLFNSSKASSLTSTLTESDILELDATRRQMLATLGLACNHVHQAGFGDTEIYARWFDRYEYYFKLRSLEYAFRFGLLIPTGVKREINKPASVPFGGNGHWGIYASADGEFEVKEDWKIGILLRASKRFARTRNERMPVDNEPQIFGVVTGLAKIDPGFTEIFAVYGQMEGLREGFGLRVQYTLINHNRDTWTDERVDKTIPVKLEPVNVRSGWASEYITLAAFYDFGKTSQDCRNQPIVRAAWDIPFTLLVGHRFVHSFRVSLGLEYNF
jgi:hypothetical protein